ncbi:MICOS complex subunit Mic10-like [Apostichopus japonicus]|uniref:MICOS complex subunit Mic10-like n=1 Tax=Stichopus japonicus TaxID=307972 RepID=UPI003AB18469
MSEQQPKRSENVLGRKWDRCVSDSLIKIAGGLGVGVIFSVFLFKRRPWPIAFGGGVGLGMGYANCQHEFNDPYNLRARIARIEPKPPGEAKTEDLKVKVEASKVNTDGSKEPTSSSSS